MTTVVAATDRASRLRAVQERQVDLRSRVDGKRWFAVRQDGKAPPGILRVFSCPVDAQRWVRTRAQDYTIVGDDLGRHLGSRVPYIYDGERDRRIGRRWAEYVAAGGLALAGVS